VRNCTFPHCWKHSSTTITSHIAGRHRFGPKLQHPSLEERWAENPNSNEERTCRQKTLLTLSRTRRRSRGSSGGRGPKHAELTRRWVWERS
jgi:hypothetical protein